MKNLLFAIVLMTTLVRCDKTNPLCPKDYHSSIKIVNQSTKRIYYHLYWDYPDNKIGDYNATWGNNPLSPNDSFNRSAGRTSCWEALFSQKPKENIYFFDADIIEKTAWTEVQKNGTGLLERREIDLDYCIKNNWQVIYK